MRNGGALRGGPEPDLPLVMDRGGGIFRSLPVGVTDRSGFTADGRVVPFGKPCSVPPQIETKSTSSQKHDCIEGQDRRLQSNEMQYTERYHEGEHNEAEDRCAA